MNNKFYITTAIAYTSRKPHIGNTYDPVLADAIARYKRMWGYDVYFLTGSDEHGQKIETCAKEQGLSPKAYVDGIADEIKAVWDKMNVSYDRFIRTTDADHESAVKNIFKKLYEQGDIYMGNYEGKYCVPCESFFTASQLAEGKCPDCGREVVDAKEEAYFLKLSKYQDRLMTYYEQNPGFFLPDSRRAEMINNFIKPGLSDLCVSRTSFKWGIPVDFDDKHVIYVWLDALSNYITGIGYDGNKNSDRYRCYWPADLHVIGKDIVRFHTVYWPIILMALGEPLPKQVLGHPWLLVGKDKMSKTSGNVLYADELAEYFGTDAVRYYLLSEIPFAQDGSITYKSLIAKYNSDLANTLGNLVNRSIAMANKYFGGYLTKPQELTGPDRDLIQTVNETVKNYVNLMDSYRNADAVGAVINLARRCNKYIDETLPWNLAKEETSKPRLNDVLYNLAESIRVLALLFYPIIPDTSQKILAQLGVECVFDINAVKKPFGETKEYHTGEPIPLFARIDAEKLLAELEAKANETALSESDKKDGEKPDEAENTAELEQILIDDFLKVDLRIAEITACEPVKKAKKLLKLTLNDGGEAPRTIVSGIAQFYSAEQLVGRNIIVVANLKPAVLCGEESCGMLLAAKENGTVKVLFADGLTPGSKLG